MPINVSHINTQKVETDMWTRNYVRGWCNSGDGVCASLTCSSFCERNLNKIPFSADMGIVLWITMSLSLPLPIVAMGDCVWDDKGVKLAVSKLTRKLSYRWSNLVTYFAWEHNVVLCYLCLDKQKQYERRCLGAAATALLMSLKIRRKTL